MGLTIGKSLIAGSALGVTFGAVVGAVTGNVGFWIAMGPTIGAGIGIVIGAILVVLSSETAEDNDMKNHEEDRCSQLKLMCKTAA